MLDLNETVQLSLFELESPVRLELYRVAKDTEQGRDTLVGSAELKEHRKCQPRTSQSRQLEFRATDGSVLGNLQLEYSVENLNQIMERSF